MTSIQADKKLLQSPSPQEANIAQNHAWSTNLCGRHHVPETQGVFTSAMCLVDSSSLRNYLQIASTQRILFNSLLIVKFSIQQIDLVLVVEHISLIVIDGFLQLVEDPLANL